MAMVVFLGARRAIVVLAEGYVCALNLKPHRAAKVVSLSNIRCRTVDALSSGYLPAVLCDCQLIPTITPTARAAEQKTVITTSA